MSASADREARRRELVAMINHRFSTAHPDDPLGFITLPLAAKLIDLGQDWIDELVGRQFLALKKADDKEAKRYGGEIRAAVEAVWCNRDDEPPADTIDKFRVAASALVGQLAIDSRDPYLQLLAQALLHIRVGQPDPFLEPAKEAPHPKRSAGMVLILRATPFCVIEFLKAADSEKYRTKTIARDAVVRRLAMTEDNLDTWRRQQNRKRRGIFKAELQAAQRMGERVKATLSDPESHASAREDAQRDLDKFGLKAIDRCVAQLNELGASRGKKHGVDK